MSGPKTSRYTLSAAQRRALAEQRRIVKEREDEKAKLAGYARELALLKSRFSEDRRRAQELHRLTGGGDDFLQKHKELIDAAQTLESLSKIREGVSLETIRAAAVQMAKGMAAVGKLAADLQGQAVRNASRLHGELLDRITRGFASDFTAVTAQDAHRKKLRLDMQSTLSSLMYDRRLSGTLLDRVKSATARLWESADGNDLNAFHSLTFAPLLKDCERFLMEYEQWHEEYARLRVSYESLCALTGASVHETQCSAVAVDFLRNEIGALEASHARDDERDYLGRTLDEVMAEMGYSVLGRRKVRKKNGLRFSSVLYRFGDGTAVSVTHSDDGKVSMELGGLDCEDRAPDVTETRQLCDEMRAFCDDFSEIERRLAAKGVVVKDRISLLPPDGEYAQIINVSDYGLPPDTEMFQALEGAQCLAEEKALRKRQADGTV